MPTQQSQTRQLFRNAARRPFRLNSDIANAFDGTDLPATTATRRTDITTCYEPTAELRIRSFYAQTKKEEMTAHINEEYEEGQCCRRSGTNQKFYQTFHCSSEPTPIDRHWLLCTTETNSAVFICPTRDFQQAGTSPLDLYVAPFQRRIQETKKWSSPQYLFPRRCIA